MVGCGAVSRMLDCDAMGRVKGRNEAGEAIDPVFQLDKMEASEAEVARTKHQVIDYLEQVIRQKIEMAVSLIVQSAWDKFQTKFDQLLVSAFGEAGKESKARLDKLAGFIFNHGIRNVLAILLLPFFCIAELLLTWYCKLQARYRIGDLYNQMHGLLVYHTLDEFVDALDDPKLVDNFRKFKKPPRRSGPSDFDYEKMLQVLKKLKKDLDKLYAEGKEPDAFMRLKIRSFMNQYQGKKKTDDASEGSSSS